MQPSYSDELPPDLLRQLDAIERSANAYERAARSGNPALADLQVFHSLPNAKRHALDAELRRAHRESRRVRQVTIAALAFGVLLAALGSLAHRMDHYFLGLGLLIIGGSVIGLGAVSAYYANARIQEVSAQIPDAKNN